MGTFKNWTDAEVALHNRKVAGDLSKTQQIIMSSPEVERESKLHDDITDYCHRKGWLVIHSRTDKPTTTAKGVSDFIIVTPNTVCFVEVKRPGKKATAEQLAFLAMVSKLGWPNFIVHSMDEFCSYMEMIHS